MACVIMRSRLLGSDQSKSTHGPQCMYDIRTVQITFTYELRHQHITAQTVGEGGHKH